MYEPTSQPQMQEKKTETRNQQKWNKQNINTKVENAPSDGSVIRTLYICVFLQTVYFLLLQVTYPAIVISLLFVGHRPPR